mmetsp:Transcript_4711/g.11918  ORF Transcript_4711/g.11918 Transcript_4711/m.11918 type:complete len:126 (+) Transcript_4711:225-602(+)
MQSPLTTISAGEDPDYVRPAPVHGRVVKPNKYPACLDQYNAYYECLFVSNKNFGKFIGACNEVKRQLDQCNVVNQELARKANHEKAKQRKQQILENEKLYDEQLAKMEAEKAQSTQTEKKPKSWW